MGKGDKKTTRGKRIAGSYGKTRARKRSVKPIPVKVLDEKEKKAPKAAVRKKVGEPTEPTENAEVEATKAAEKPKTTRKKKTEE